jgi:aspartate carbamoyltransferase catalytic subunit
MAHSWRVCKARLARTKLEPLIMHPGPVNRGVAIDSDIADSARSLILEQVTNGLACAWPCSFWSTAAKERRKWREVEQ